MKNYIFAKIQEGGGRHLRFWIFGHISVIYGDICFKFGVLIEIDHIWVAVTLNPTFTKFKTAAVAMFNFGFSEISRSSMKMLASNLVR